jgi:integrase
MSTVNRLARTNRKERTTMRQEQGKKTKHKGVYTLSDGTFRVVAKVKDPKTDKSKFVEKLTREVDGEMSINEAVAYRGRLIEEIKKGTSGSGVPNEIPRLSALVHSSWITFLASGMMRERSVTELGREIDNHIAPRWGDYFIDRIEVAEIDAWARQLEEKCAPRTVRERIGILRRVLSKARGQWKLPPLDWDLVSLPTTTDEHAKQNRLAVDEIVPALLACQAEYPFYAPMIFTMYSTGLRYCHVAAMRWAKLSTSGVVAIEESYDYKTKKFGPVLARKNAPPQIQLEPHTHELVREHRKRLMSEDHPGLKSGLLFPSASGDLPVGNDQLNDVWREAQLKAGVTKPVSVHGIRHTFHDIARKRGVDAATVKLMAGHATDARHFLYSQGVDLEEVGQASRLVAGAFLERAGGGSPPPPVSADSRRAMDVFNERAARVQSAKRTPREGRDRGRDAKSDSTGIKKEGRTLISG